MLRFSKTALVASALTAFPTPILPVSFEFESQPALELRESSGLQPPFLVRQDVRVAGDLDAQAILRAVQPALCPDGLCALTLTEYALIEVGREAAPINGLLSPIDRRLLELFDGPSTEPLLVDLLFDNP